VSRDRWYCRVALDYLASCRVGSSPHLWPMSKTLIQSIREAKEPRRCECAAFSCRRFSWTPDSATSRMSSGPSQTLTFSLNPDLTLDLGLALGSDLVPVSKDWVAYGSSVATRRQTQIPSIHQHAAIANPQAHQQRFVFFYAIKSSYHVIASQAHAGGVATQKLQYDRNPGETIRRHPLPNFHLCIRNPATTSALAHPQWRSMVRNIDSEQQPQRPPRPKQPKQQGQR
jgi:hypothetical protein